VPIEENTFNCQKPESYSNRAARNYTEEAKRFMQVSATIMEGLNKFMERVKNVENVSRMTVCSVVCAGGAARACSLWRKHDTNDPVRPTAGRARLPPVLL